MAILIDGKVLAEKIRRNLKIECDSNNNILRIEDIKND